MGLQEKMETDHLWIKPVPGSPVNGPNSFGQFYLDESSPNYKE